MRGLGSGRGCGVPRCGQKRAPRVAPRGRVQCLRWSGSAGRPEAVRDSMLAPQPARRRGINDVGQEKSAVRSNFCVRPSGRDCPVGAAPIAFRPSRYPRPCGGRWQRGPRLGPGTTPRHSLPVRNGLRRGLSGLCPGGRPGGQQHATRDFPGRRAALGQASGHGGGAGRAGAERPSGGWPTGRPARCSALPRKRSGAMPLGMAGGAEGPLPAGLPRDWECEAGRGTFRACIPAEVEATWPGS